MIGFVIVFTEPVARASHGNGKEGRFCSRGGAELRRGTRLVTTAIRNTLNRLNTLIPLDCKLAERKDGR